MRCSTWISLMCLSSATAQTWSPLPGFPGSARDDAAAFAIGSTAYLGTGLDDGFALTNDWYAYDSVNETWEQVASLPAEARQYSASFSIGDRGYLFGGTQGLPFNDLWSYDAVNDLWSQRSSLPAPGRSGSTAFVLNGKGYVFGGRLAAGSALSDELWEYDPQLDSWTEKASYPGGPRLLSCAFAIGAYGYVVGGLDTTINAQSNGWRYDPAGDAWDPIAPLAIRFDAQGYGTPWSGVVVCGGTTYTSFLNDAWQYHPTDDTWSQLPLLPGPLRKGGRGVFIGNDLLLYGTGVDNVQRYDDWFKLEWPVGIEESEEKPSFILSPVPADEVLNIDAQRGSSGSIVLVDALGRVIERAILMSDRTSIDTQHLPSGAYRVLVIDDHGTSSCSFIVSH